jgi:hypothetical protein
MWRLPNGATLCTMLALASACRHVVVLSFSIVAVTSRGTPPHPSLLKGWAEYSATKPAARV